MSTDEFLEMPEPEPVAYCYAWIDEDGDEVNRLGFTVPSEGFDAIPLHTTPPDQSARIAELEQQLAALQAKREQLSDDEIQDIHNEQPSRSTYYEFARAIEAAHGIGVNHE